MAVDIGTVSASSLIQIGFGEDIAASGIAQGILVEFPRPGIFPDGSAVSVGEKIDQYVVSSADLPAGTSVEVTAHLRFRGNLTANASTGGAVFQADVKAAVARPGENINWGLIQTYAGRSDAQGLVQLKREDVLPFRFPVRVGEPFLLGRMLFAGVTGGKGAVGTYVVGLTLVDDAFLLAPGATIERIPQDAPPRCAIEVR